MKKLLAVGAFLTLALPLLQALPDYLARSDELSRADKNMESFNLLMGALPAAKTERERAEIYWRLSRDTFIDADNRRYAGATVESLLSLYQKSEAYADQAMALDPDNPKGVYLKACNIGRREQARGTYASLSRADLMRKLLVKVVRSDPQASGPWYVLAQLYEQAPSWPLSFGNVAWAVSLGRKALDAGKAELADGVAREVPLDYSIQLARQLVKRDWSCTKRTQEQADEARRYHETSDPVEKNYSYEGTVQIPPLSDRAEARQLCQFVISQLHDLPRLSLSQNADLRNAQMTLAALDE